jgi:hypothetical protein
MPIATPSSASVATHATLADAVDADRKSVILHPLHLLAIKVKPSIGCGCSLSTKILSVPASSSAYRWHTFRPDSATGPLLMRGCAASRPAGAGP